MPEEASVLSVVLGGIAFAVGTILVLIVSTLLFARYLQWKIQDLSLLQRQLAQFQHRTSRWLAVQILFSSFVIFLGVFLAIKARWNLIPLLLLLVGPISLVLRGIAVLDSQVEFDNLPFRPVRLLTGHEAVRRGKIYIAAGSISFIFCLILTIIAAAC